MYEQLEFAKKYSQRLKKSDVFDALSMRVRRDILKALEFQNFTYNSIGKTVGLHRTKIAYHIRFLVKHHLIALNKSNNVYYLTVRGSQVIKHVHAIEKSEMFICDL